VRRGGVTEARVEDDKAVKVRVVRIEVACLVNVVEVIDKRANLHRVADAVFDNGTERVERCAFGKGEFVFAVRHALRPDEVEGELDTVEEVGQLHPCFAGKGGLRTGAKDKETDSGRRNARVLPGVAATSPRRVKSMTKCFLCISIARVIMKIVLTAETLQALWCHASILADVVRT